MLQITVDIFSGRPNPSWVVDEKEAKDVLKEITTNREVVAEVGSGHQGLGYRGVLLEPLAEDMRDEYNLPSSFMIANGGSGDEKKGLEIAKRMVDNMPRYSARDETIAALTPLDEELRGFLLEQMTAFPKVMAREIPKPVRVTEPDEPKVEERAAKVCYIELCRFNPGFWNNDPYVRQNNNCYNYGRNCRTDTFAQPGRASGSPVPFPPTCDSVTKGALSDGAHRRYDCFPDSEKPRWFMAMAIWPGRDYHWYRKSSEGFWGHKPGGTAARNYDNSGRVIYDPQTCNRGGYTDFCGYFYACKSMRIR
ncbi:MAG: hypothetical protein AYK19_05550 [Theionarchaea archaeon DG-70-1]|nr:MAG: hypothetical protein AYK19_05550 [Theionarchaea archaeon DG-70-1]